MESIMNPSIAGQAFDRFMSDVVPATPEHRLWTPTDGAMPAIFLSHGAPPVFDDPLWIEQFWNWSQALPKPTAILVVSAHWEQAPLRLSATGAGTSLIYDFGGFHPRYFEMTYSTPDASALGAQVAELLSNGEPLAIDPSRGLDHGAWVPLKIMYPHADVPVLQLSIPTHDPRQLFAIGQQLKVLREQGVLLMSSGFMTHGLPFLTQAQFQFNEIPAWSSAFDQWAAEALASGNVDELARFGSVPTVRFAHPTVEHFTPLFVTLGAASDLDAGVETTIEGYQFGLSKRSFQVA